MYRPNIFRKRKSTLSYCSYYLWMSVVLGNETILSRMPSVTSTNCMQRPYTQRNYFSHRSESYVPRLQRQQNIFSMSTNKICAQNRFVVKFSSLIIDPIKQEINILPNVQEYTHGWVLLVAIGTLNSDFRNKNIFQVIIQFLTLHSLRYVQYRLCINSLTIEHAVQQQLQGTNPSQLHIRFIRSFCSFCKCGIFIPFHLKQAEQQVLDTRERCQR